MANIKCKICGADLSVMEGTITVECDYCGSVQTVHGGDCKNVTTSISQGTKIDRNVPDATALRIPSNNRYAGYEELVLRIARDIVNEAFSHAKPMRWVPVSCNTKVCEYSLVFGFEKDRISVYCDLGREREHKYFYFIDYGRKQLPDVDDFVSAIEPFIKKYGNDAGNRAFANIDKLSSYSMKCGSEISRGSPRIYVLIEQVLHPDNSLKSW